MNHFSVQKCGCYSRTSRAVPFLLLCYQSFSYTFLLLNVGVTGVTAQVAQRVWVQLWCSQNAGGTEQYFGCTVALLRVENACGICFKVIKV